MKAAYVTLPIFWQAHIKCIHGTWIWGMAGGQKDIADATFSQWKHAQRWRQPSLQVSAFFFFFRTHFSIALSLILGLEKKDNESAELQKQHQDLWCTLFKSKIKQILQMQIVFTSTVYSRQSLFLFPFCLTFLSWTPKPATLQGLLSCRVANFSSFLLRP